MNRKDIFLLLGILAVIMLFWLMIKKTKEADERKQQEPSKVLSTEVLDTAVKLNASDTMLNKLSKTSEWKEMPFPDSALKATARLLEKAGLRQKHDSLYIDYYDLNQAYFAIGQADKNPETGKLYGFWFYYPKKQKLVNGVSFEEIK